MDMIMSFKNNEFTPKQRVLYALRKEPVDHVPFTIYEGYAKQGVRQRLFREQGMCIVVWDRSYKIDYKDVDIQELHYTEKGRRFIRTEYHTPRGLLTRLEEIDSINGSRWTMEFPFKSPEDYPALRAYYESRRATADYDRALSLAEERGDDYLIRDTLPSEPIQQMIAWGMFNTQDFLESYYPVISPGLDEVMAIIKDKVFC
jgi:hypothetical protein